MREQQAARRKIAHGRVCGRLAASIFHAHRLTFRKWTAPTQRPIRTGSSPKIHANRRESARTRVSDDEKRPWIGNMRDPLISLTHTKQSAKFHFHVSRALLEHRTPVCALCCWGARRSCGLICVNCYHIWIQMTLWTANIASQTNMLVRFPPAWIIKRQKIECIMWFVQMTWCRVSL